MKKITAIACFALAAGLLLPGAPAASYAQETAQAASAPYIFKVTDAVSPGEQFSLNGEYFTSASEVFAYPVGRSEGEVSLPVTQYDTTDRQYLVCTLPENMAGAWDVRVRNESGLSEAYTLNGPRPLYISETEAWAGQTLQISGRNFDLADFGGEETLPQVTLYDAEAQKS